MQLVQLNEQYIEELKQFMQICWNDTYKGILAQDFIDQFLEKAYSTERLIIRAKLPFYLMLDNEKIVGMANFSKVNEVGETTLLAIYVHPNYKGQGIGSRLLNEGMIQLKPTVINLDVEKENYEAIQFYENKNFVKVEEYEEELFGHTLNTIRMKREVQ